MAGSISHFMMLQIQFHPISGLGKHSFYNEFFTVKGNILKDFTLIRCKIILVKMTLLLSYNLDVGIYDMIFRHI